MSQIPKTAGGFLTEEKLRAYVRCSQFYHFGGEVKADFSLRLRKRALEQILAIMVRKDVTDPQQFFSKAVGDSIGVLNREEHLTDSQLEVESNQTLLWLGEFFQMFSHENYILVSPPQEYTVKVRRTPIVLHVSGVFRSRQNQTVHIITVVPYVTEHSMVNDPITHLKLQTMKRFVKEHNSGRAQAIIHTFSLRQNGNLCYTSLGTNEVTPDYLEMIELMVDSMERGYHFPLVPCPYTCPFKPVCIPSGAHNKNE